MRRFRIVVFLLAAAFPAGSSGFNGFAARYDTFTPPLLAPTPHG